VAHDWSIKYTFFMKSSISIEEYSYSCHIIYIENDEGYLQYYIMPGYIKNV